MKKNDFSYLEDQIKDTLKNTFKAIDFAKLKENIDDKASDTLKELKTNIKSKSQSINEKIKGSNFNTYSTITSMIERNKNEVQMYISKKPVGRISGILYMTIGFALIGVFGALLIAYSMFTSFLNLFSPGVFITLGLLFSFFISGVTFTLKGLNLRKRLKRFKEYVKTLDNSKYCSIDELAVAIGKKPKFVVKDLRKMIDLGMFLEGHIDDEKAYFMLGNEVYENYLHSQEAFKSRKAEEFKKQEELDRNIKDLENKELKYVIEMGRNYIEQIKAVSTAIHREEFSEKLYRLQNVVTEIFKHLGNNPRKLNEVSKFTNHYLPITLKLVNSYKELSDKPVQGENIKNAKNEIEKSIDIINTAFEKLLDDLFEEVALDISTDISVLETLFTQEGLTKNDFKKSNNGGLKNE